MERERHALEVDYVGQKERAEPRVSDWSFLGDEDQVE
jgi:hypothetical protein